VTEYAGLPPIEVSTLCLPIALLAFLLAGIALGLARSAPAPGAGALRCWAASMGLVGLTFACYLFRGHAPLLLTYVLANTAAVSGTWLAWRSHALLRGLPPHPARGRLAIAGSGSACLLAWAGGMPLAAGAAIASMSTAAIFACITHAEFRAWRRWRCPSTLFAAGGAGLCGTGILLRGVVTLTVPMQSVTMTGMPNSGIAAFLLAGVYIIANTVNLVCRMHGLAEDALRERAAHDPLTGLLTRGAFFERGQAALLASRGQAAALMIDIDHFKAINDRHGHRTGDLCIAATGALIADTTRRMAPGSLAGRYGGEEFCVLLTDVEPMAAARLAEQLVAGARSAVVDAEGAALRYTLSVGHACEPAPATGRATPPLESSPHAELVRLLDRADTALYAAKQAGRDRAYPPQDPSVPMEVRPLAATGGTAIGQPTPC